MSLITVIAVFFVIWWVSFVAMANIGVKSQEEAGHIVKGTPAGAPHTIHLWRKFMWVTLVAAIVTAFIYWVIEYSGFTLADYPFMPDFKDYA
ncbi:MAG: DUF1467 family protein [Rhizobiales bacterium]|nr:DUF1467 family protein [Hyphomicrobiales bacterium]NRB12847.1 DUF1467 family protein [Hyphomicrobiales bacterium]